MMKREDIVGVYRRRGDEVVDAAGKVIHSDQQRAARRSCTAPTVMSAWSARRAGGRRPRRSGGRTDLVGATPEELVEATRSVTCYAGHYEVKGDEVHHHIEMALNPSLVGQTMIRRVHFDWAEPDAVGACRTRRARCGGFCGGGCRAKGHSGGRTGASFDLDQDRMKLRVLQVEQLVRAAARLAVDDIAEHVGDLALAAVLPAHQRLALAHRHDQIGMLVLMQRLVALAAAARRSRPGCVRSRTAPWCRSGRAACRISMFRPCSPLTPRTVIPDARPWRRHVKEWKNAYKINRLKSAFLARSPMCFCT